MSNWYKTANLGNNLTFVISTWLRNARNNPQVGNANDDISFQMEGVDNAEQLSSAITAASNIVMREQGGSLTESQQELLTTISQRIQDQQMPQQDLGVGDMNQSTDNLSPQPLEAPQM